MQGLRLLQQQALRQLQHARPSQRPLTFERLRLQTQPLFRTRLSQSLQTRSYSYSGRQNLLSRLPKRVSRVSRRFNSTTAQSEEALSLSQRLKKLSREYGWSAVGVYLALSALDFPFCFLTVRWVGVETIGHYEHVIVSYIKSVAKWPLGSDAQEAVDKTTEKVKENLPQDLRSRVLEEGTEGQTYEYEFADHGFKEADEANKGSNASIWTQLALAYAIHKSFIFIRVPLTAAVTPKVVKTLRGWGWNIGKMPTRKSKAKTGVNTKGSRVKPDDD